MSDLLELIYSDGDDLTDQVRGALARGADPNAMTEYGESPLRIASRNGRFEVVQILLDAGAEAEQLGWSPLHYDIALAGDDALVAALARSPELSARDYWGRTPYLLALQVGDLQMAARLLGAGADPYVRGPHGATPAGYAISGDHAEVLRWLLARGEDIEQTDDWGQTALLRAVSEDARRCLEILIDAGGDVSARSELFGAAIEIADDPAVIRKLIDAGEDINKLNAEARARLTGLVASEVPEVTTNDYMRARHPRFGASNPERVDEPFLQMMIRTRESAWSARQRFDPDGSARQAVWSFDRYGTSITALGDGRYIEIAGEHEDHYDPDFHIYNDVFVYDGDGACAIYRYPREDFAPTDFHTATLVGDTIWIIGNLGYPADRRPEKTPVYTLDINSLEIQAVATTGDNPGWISEHRADLVGEADSIVVRGGKRIDEDGEYANNRDTYALSPSSRIWTRLSDA